MHCTKIAAPITLTSSPCWERWSFFLRFYSWQCCKLLFCCPMSQPVGRSGATVNHTATDERTDADGAPTSSTNFGFGQMRAATAAVSACARAVARDYLTTHTCGQFPPVTAVRPSPKSHSDLSRLWPREEKVDWGEIWGDWTRVPGRKCDYSTDLWRERFYCCRRAVRVRSWSARALDSAAAVWAVLITVTFNEF